MARKGFVISLLLALGVLTMTSYSANVTYDHRALVIDGKRRLLTSGSIHYPRSTPDVILSLLIILSLEIEFINLNVGFCHCRCGRGLFRNLRMEVWMWLKLTFSGIYMNQFEAGFVPHFASSFLLCYWKIGHWIDTITAASSLVSEFEMSLIW